MFQPRLIIMSMLLSVKMLCAKIVLIEYLQIDAILLEISSVRNVKESSKYFNVRWHLQCDYGWNQVKYARFMITDIFCICIIICLVRWPHIQTASLERSKY